MMAAYAILFLPPLWWAVWQRMRGAGRDAVPAYAAVALFTLFIGLRHGLGGDWHAYWLMLERSQSHDVATALLISDPAYMALNIVAGRLGLNLGAVNLVCAAILAGGAVALSRRQPYPWLALLVAVPVLLAVVGMTATRQSAAVGLEMLALAWLADGRRRTAAAALAGAVLFHWSAVILLPLALLAVAPEKWRRGLRAGCAVLGVILLAAIYARGFTGSGGASAGGALLRLIPALAAAAIVAVGLRASASGLGNGESRLAAVYLAAVALLCAAAWPASSLAADRLGYYTIPLQMIAFPWLLASVTGPSLRRAVAGAVCLFYAALFAIWFALSSQTRCLMPYRSYLEQPQLLIGWEAPRPLCS